jgi:hypothetical protein
MLFPLKFRLIPTQQQQKLYISFPSAPRALTLAGACHTMLSRPSHALSLLSKALNQTETAPEIPRCPEALWWGARVLSGTGDHAGAAQMLRYLAAESASVVMRF